MRNTLRPKLELRHNALVDILEYLLPDVHEKAILEIACGHRARPFCWFQDLNQGPLLSEYLAEQGANVTGVDEWHRFFEKKIGGFTKKWGAANRIGKYFESESFDAVISCAFFGYPSSRSGNRPSVQFEYAILKQAFDLTKPGGIGIHYSADRHWQLEPSHLIEIGYDVLSDMGKPPPDNINVPNDGFSRPTVILQKPYATLSI